jgi:hypothetical protein
LTTDAMFQGQRFAILAMFLRASRKNFSENFPKKLSRKTFHPKFQDKLALKLP